MKNTVKYAMLVFMIVPAFASADEKKAQGSGPSPYVECGIGAALFPTTNWAAVTSNATWDLGSTAITSALSSPETCSAKKMKTAKLILETLPELEKEVAMGEGKYLDAMISTAGCSSSNNTAITAKMRANYAQTVSSSDYASQSRIDRATNFYSNAKDAMSSANCNVAL